MNNVFRAAGRVTFAVWMTGGTLGAVVSAQAQEPVWRDIGAADISQTNLAIYPRQGLVSQAVNKTLPAGLSQVQLRPDFDNWVLETLTLMVQGEQTEIAPEQQSWNKPLVNRSELVSHLEGQRVELFRPGRDAPLKGLLQVWTGESGLLLLPDNKQEIFQWQDGMSLRTVDHQPLSPAMFNPQLKARFRLQQPADNLGLTYLNRGLGYSNQYRLTVRPASSTLDVGLKTTLRNNSTTDYHKASLQLASGDAGANANAAPPVYARQEMKMAMGMDSADSGERAGELLFLTLPGVYDLPAGGSLTLPLLEDRGLGFSSRYRYSFYGQGHPGSRTVKDNPVHVLAFKPVQDLPSGPVQVYETSGESPARLVHQSHINQTAEGSELELALGRAYAVTVERTRLSTRQKSKQWVVEWQLKVSNQHNRNVHLVIEDTDSDMVAMDDLKGLKREGEMVFAIIPASSSQTLSFVSTYRKN